MKILIIEQITKLGHKKSWRITPNESPAVFGSSRVAQVISQDPDSTPFEGVFEFQDSQWTFFDLHRDRLENSLTQKLNEESVLKFCGSDVKVTCYEKKASLSEMMDRSGDSDLAGATTAGKKPFQLFVLRHGTQVVETQVLGLKRSFKTKHVENAPAIKCIKSTDWHRQPLGLYELSQKTVFLNNQSELTSVANSKLMDQDSRRNSFIIVCASFVIGILALVAPKSPTEYARPDYPRSSQKLVFKNETHKKREVQAAALTAPARQPAAIPQDNGGGKTTGVKVAHLLKNLQEGRISNLIGKVSAQAARSKNLIISSGQAAGISQSGPALSALGGIEKGQHDWGTDAKGAGLTINTQGKGGGKNTSNMGALSGGKVGAGGVGLIEDESEVVGGLDRDIIAQYIKTQLGQILYCYERQLSAQPDLFGKVAIRFEIGTAGEVTSQKIGDTTLKNATVEGCILNRVAAWKFPAPQGGTKVLVTYPFLFKSTN